MRLSLLLLGWTCRGCECYQGLAWCADMWTPLHDRSTHTRLIYPCSLSASISTSYFHCKLNIGCPSNLSVSNTVHRICLQQEDNTSSGPLQLVQNLRVRSRTSDNSQVSTYLNRLCCILGKCPVLCRSKWPSHQNNTNLLDVKQTNKSHVTTGTNHNLKTTTTRQSRLNSKKRRKIGYTL